MDAPSLTPERSRELADLRRRAYGPDADIHLDPEALQRLHELEALQRVDGFEASERAAARSTAAQAPAGAPAIAAPTAAVEPATSSAHEVPDAGIAAEQTISRSWWRRIPLWVSLVAVGIIGLLVGLAAATAQSPRADVTLERTDEMQLNLEDEWVLSISQWLTLEAVPVQYEAFHELQVLSATSEQGSSCLVVTWPSHWSDYSCTPQGLTPVVDFVAYVGGPQPLDEPQPPGTVIRFELRGDVVEVTMRERTD